MNKGQLLNALSTLHLVELQYFDSIGSTNDEALKWASQHAPDLSIIVADEQTAGRGRSNRKWFTPASSALSLSLILRPSATEKAHPAHITGLGALALTDVLHTLGLDPKIKWPNDVLINSRKVAGILVESVWSGDTLIASVLGMGVNVLSASVPPDGEMFFPPTCIENETGQTPDRIELFKGIILAIIKWRKKLGEDEFIQAWDDALAFHGEQVQIMRDQEMLITGELLGLGLDGSLVVRKSDGNLQELQFGEIQLRPAL
jgi:BirA family transcriptional regulator, biotin operon repressor / biotin---[acetyl-CoA-carboxylase] ligase